MNIQLTYTWYFNKDLTFVVCCYGLDSSNCNHHESIIIFCILRSEHGFRLFAFRNHIISVSLSHAFLLKFHHFLSSGYSTFQSSLFQTLTKWTPTTLSGTKYGCNRHLTPDPNHVAHGSTLDPPCLCLRYCPRTESWWPTRGKSFVCERLNNQGRAAWLSIIQFHSKVQDWNLS